jgi:hypothetical protein
MPPSASISTVSVRVLTDGFSRDSLFRLILSLEFTEVRLKNLIQLNQLKIILKRVRPLGLKQIPANYPTPVLDFFSIHTDQFYIRT